MSKRDSTPFYDHCTGVIDVSPRLSARDLDLADAMLYDLEGKHQPILDSCEATLAEIQEKIRAFEAEHPKTCEPRELTVAEFEAECAIEDARYNYDLDLNRYGYSVGRRVGFADGVALAAKHMAPGGDPAKLSELIRALTDPEACEKLLWSLYPAHVDDAKAEKPEGKDDD
jgi:hypothetical protein